METRKKIMIGLAMLGIFISIALTGVVRAYAAEADDFPLQVRWNGAMVRDLQKIEPKAIKAFDDAVDFDFGKNESCITLLFWGDAASYFRIIFRAQGKYIEVDFDEKTAQFRSVIFVVINSDLCIRLDEGDLTWDPGSKKELEDFARGLLEKAKRILGPPPPK